MKIDKNASIESKTPVSGAQIEPASGATVPESENEIISCYDKRFEDLTIADDFMFKVVFSNPKICKQLIEIILKKKIVRLGFCPCFFLGFALFFAACKLYCVFKSFLVFQRLPKVFALRARNRALSEKFSAENRGELQKRNAVFTNDKMIFFCSDFAAFKRKSLRLVVERQKICRSELD